MKLGRPSIPWLGSIAIHVVVIALFVQALWMRHPLFDFLGRSRPVATEPAERIGFLTLPSPHQITKGPPQAARAGGDGRSATPRPVVPLVAPTQVPSVIKPPSTTGQTTTEPSSGPLIGGGGPLRGVQPRYNDARLWGAPGAVAAAPKTAAERLDSVIVGDIKAHNDSVRVATGNQREPGDWTFQHNGKKYGIDRKYIRLGPVSIPTAVLALLPLNVTGNPTTYEREHTLTARHDEIFEQAQRGINEADFNKAVREIRERKERERKEAAEVLKKAAEEEAARKSSN